jgi:sugar fermentation stimulation protein A
MRLFRNDLEGIFLSRPNRFVVEADTPRGIVRAHCPNPGRMQELLLPRTPVILEDAAARDSEVRPGERPGTGSRSLRKTRYSLAACRRQDKIISLNSSRANLAAEHLVIPRLFPGWREIRREVKHGASRFDFEVTSDGRRHLVEVKACTLCEHGVAMFPDAPTVRGTRHVLELIESTEAGFVPHVILAIFHRDARIFVPNIHTDPVFALALREAAEKGAGIHAAVVEAEESGDARLLAAEVPVDLSPAVLAGENRGVYLLVLEVPGGTLRVGGLGEIHFSPGFYVYVGSAAKNLDQRIARHGRLRKKLKWHIDYLRAAASSFRAFPIRTRRDLECRLASDIATGSGVSISGFGSSDCSCRAHLFYYRENPLENRGFVDTLSRYRHLEAFGPTFPGGDAPSEDPGIEDDKEDYRREEEESDNGIEERR